MQTGIGEMVRTESERSPKESERVRTSPTSRSVASVSGFALSPNGVRTSPNGSNRWQQIICDSVRVNPKKSPSAFGKKIEMAQNFRHRGGQKMPCPIHNTTGRRQRDTPNHTGQTMP